MTEQVEIYFDNLHQELQEQLLKASGVEKPEDGNWDTFPVTVIEFEEEPEKGGDQR